MDVAIEVTGDLDESSFGGRIGMKNLSGIYLREKRNWRQYIHDTFDGLAANVANNEVGESSLRAGEMDYEVIILY